ncbi:MAG TPA: hydrogen peroxide-inducible genes activator [Parvularculaceae bacterium]|nr:hydrogen peroxide-inducible genes activator [Parvularculaceae bacterium]
MSTDAELTLKQLRCLLAVEQFRHFRRAAEHLGVTQPSLSVQISNLEEALELDLVERNRRGAALTPAGRDIADRARRILEEEKALRDYASGARGGLKGTINLGVAPTIGPYLLPHIVQALHRRHPQLGLYVREDAPRELDFDLGRAAHDAILTPLRVDGPDFVSEPLFQEPLYLAVAADHPLAKKETLSTGDLKGLKVLMLSARHQLHDQAIALCNSFGALPARDFEGTSLDSLRLMVGMGMGAAFLPALYAHSEVRPRSEIVIKKIGGRRLVRTISLAWRKNAHGAQAYREIAEMARATARKKFPDLIPAESPAQR